MPCLHVIVSCSNRKTGSLSENLLLRNVPAESVCKRAKKWAKVLTLNKGNGRPAREVYSGNHWAVARELPSMSTENLRVQLWICSAGYGLLRDDAPILPYGATFTPGHKDSVAERTNTVDFAEQLGQWWSALASCLDKPSAPTTIEALVEMNPNDSFLVAMAENYLWAVSKDLATASRQIQPDRIGIITSTKKTLPGDLESFRIPVNHNLQPLVGGSLISLNVRLARLAIRDALAAGGFSQHLLNSQFQERLDYSISISRPTRAAVSDDYVMGFIRSQLKADSSFSRTRMLRAFRDNGRACEQNRFAGLYRRIVTEMARR